MATRRLARKPAEPDTVDLLFQRAVKYLQSGNTAEADTLFAELLAQQADHADALCNRGIIRIMGGDLAGGIAFLERALAHRQDDAAVRDNLAKAYRLHYTSLFEAGKLQESVAVLRKLLVVDPADANARINLSEFLALGGGPSMLSDYLPHAEPQKLGCHVLIACMPKSGSSFLQAALETLTGWPSLPLASAYQQNEQEIYLPHLVNAALANTVTQQHLRATGPNLQIIHAFGIRPVVLVRNLFDIVLSMSDFYDAGAERNSFFRGRWSGFDTTTKHDVVIDHIMPWYLAFHVSWEEAMAAGSVPALRVTYEEMIADKPSVLHRIARHVGIDRSLADCEAAIGKGEQDRVRTRFNKGIAGRGDATLTGAQKDRLRRLAAAYPDMDFSLVGL